MLDETMTSIEGRREVKKRRFVSSFFRQAKFRPHFGCDKMIQIFLVGDGTN
jgi:hypothetical protein